MVCLRPVAWYEYGPCKAVSAAYFGMTNRSCEHDAVTRYTCTKRILSLVACTGTSVQRNLEEQLFTIMCRFNITSSPLKVAQI